MDSESNPIVLQYSYMATISMEKSICPIVALRNIVPRFNIDP